MNLAQANIARFRWALDDPRMADFVERIDPVYRLAEQSEGFVWRYSEPFEPLDGDAPWDDPLLFFNMSVWRDLASLRAYLATETHIEMVRNPQQWVESVEGPALAMWWIDEDERPTIMDAVEAFTLLKEQSDSERVFANLFDADTNHQASTREETR